MNIVIIDIGYMIQDQDDIKKCIARLKNNKNWNSGIKNVIIII